MVDSKQIQLIGDVKDRTKEQFLANAAALLFPVDWPEPFGLVMIEAIPNEFDRAHGRTGSSVMVHGDCASAGCYAMTDEQISEIYALARESFFGGQRAFQVQAYPFRMTPANLAKHRDNPNMPFWHMLKDGNDHFEVTRLLRKPVRVRCGGSGLGVAGQLQPDRNLPRLPGPARDRCRRCRETKEGSAPDGGAHRPRDANRAHPKRDRRRHASGLPRQVQDGARPRGWQ